MQQKELAVLLDISTAMVSRLAKRGMPTDSLERAQKWRRRHLEASRTKGVRFDPNMVLTVKPQAAKRLAQKCAGQTSTEAGHDDEDSPVIDDDADFESYYTKDHAANYHIARSFRERELAAQARIERMKLEGLLVEKSDVERAAFTEARMMRDALMGLPTKIAPLLAPVSDAFELERMLREALRKLITDYVLRPIEDEKNI